MKITSHSLKVLSIILIVGASIAPGLARACQHDKSASNGQPDATVLTFGGAPSAPSGASQGPAPGGQPAPSTSQN